MNKLKDFWSENKATIGVSIIGGALFALGYVIGQRELMRNYNVGLTSCFLVKPELKPLMLEALQEVKKKR